LTTQLPTARTKNTANALSSAELAKFGLGHPVLRVHQPYEPEQRLAAESRGRASRRQLPFRRKSGLTAGSGWPGVAQGRYRARAMETLSGRGRAVRVVVTAIGAVLLLAGTLWGADDDFPFGPFKMYSTAPGADADAPDTRVEGVDTTGRVVVLTEANSGLRRAEFEGQQQAYVDHPARLRQVALAYADRSPAAAPLRTVRIVIHWVDIENSRVTGTSHDETIVSWTAP
jgi:hypothetical protein